MLQSSILSKFKWISLEQSINLTKIQYDTISGNKYIEGMGGKTLKKKLIQDTSPG